MKVYAERVDGRGSMEHPTVDETFEAVVDVWRRFEEHDLTTAVPWRWSVIPT